MRADSGNAMIIALLVLFLLTSVGISYVAVTKGDKQIAGTRWSDPRRSTTPRLVERGAPPHVRPLRRNQLHRRGLRDRDARWGKYIVTDPGNSGLDPNYNSTLTDA